MLCELQAVLGRLKYPSAPAATTRLTLGTRAQLAHLRRALTLLEAVPRRQQIVSGTVMRPVIVAWVAYVQGYRVQTAWLCVLEHVDGLLGGKQE